MQEANPLEGPMEPISDEDDAKVGESIGEKKQSKVVYLVIVLLILLLLVSTGVIIYLLRENKQDTKIDESTAKTETSSTVTTSSTVSITTSTTVDEYQGWQTYNDSASGISFRYPPTWEVNELPLQVEESGIVSMELNLEIVAENDVKYGLRLNPYNPYKMISTSSLEIETLNLGGYEIFREEVDESNQEMYLYYVDYYNRTRPGSDAHYLEINGYEFEIFYVSEGDDLERQLIHNNYTTFEKLLLSLIESIG